MWQIGANRKTESARSDDVPHHPGPSRGAPVSDGLDGARQAVLLARVGPTIVVASDDSVPFMHGELEPYLRFPQGDHARFELDDLIRPELAPCTRAAVQKCRQSGEPVTVLASPDADDEARVRICVSSAAATEEDLGRGAVVIAFEDAERELYSANDPGAAELLAERLATKKRRLELAWRAARGGIYEHRVPLDETTHCSEEWVRVLGYRRDELPAPGEILSWIREQTHPDHRARLERAYDDFVAGRAPAYDLEVQIRHKSGRWLWVRAVSQAIERDEAGRVTQVLGFMMDVTDRKKVEEALRHSERRFREMADGLPILVWIQDEHGDRELVNETLCEFFGVERKALSADLWSSFLHPGDTGYMRALRASLRERRPFHAEARVRRADGQWRWIESWGRPRFDAVGDFRGIVGTSIDVTSSKEAERALRESESRFRALADNMSQLAWTAEADGRILWYNQRWLAFTGRTLAQMLDGGWEQVLHPDHVARMSEHLRRAVETGAPWEDTVPIQGVDGDYRWFLTRAVPIRNDEGRVVRWLGTSTDITERQRAERRLRDADRRKDEFLAMLGHELRNPLAAILTATELMRLIDVGEPKLERAIAVLERQCGHMAKLLDGLLDVSRVTRGKLTIDEDLIDLGELLGHVTDDSQEHARSAGVELDVELPAEPVPVTGDATRLTQVFSNIVGNGIKFTSSGGRVKVTLELERAGAVVTVRDTGRGFSPEMRDLIFEPFQQGPQDLARASGGLGLGLALVRGLVELHGGSVGADSEGLGRGATFVVRLPVTRDAAFEAKGMPSSDTGSLDVLLIEDNEDSAAMMRELLELAGHRVSHAARGPAGVALARERRPDVIVCDLGLPEMTGFEVAETLRDQPETHGIPIIALTGYSRPEDRERTAAAGFDAHIAKPARRAALEQAIAAVSRSARLQ